MSIKRTDYKKLPDEDTIQDILALVSCQVTKKEIRSWSPELRERIVKWAGAVHLRASDNIVRVPKRPRFKYKEITFRGIL